MIILAHVCIGVCEELGIPSAVPWQGMSHLLYSRVTVARQIVSHMTTLADQQAYNVVALQCVCELTDQLFSVQDTEV